MIKQALLAACTVATLTGFAAAQGTSAGTATGGSAAGGSGAGTSGAASGAGGSGDQASSTSAHSVPGWGGNQGSGAQPGAGTQPGQSGSGQGGQNAQTRQSGQPAPGGLIIVNPRTVVVTYYTTQPADTLASRIMKATVYKNEGKKIGNINDLFIDQGRNIADVVIGVGGFLGIGERYISLPPSAIVLTPQGDRPYRAIINAKRESVRNAPEFEFEGDQSRYDRSRRWGAVRAAALCTQEKNHG